MATSVYTLLLLTRQRLASEILHAFTLTVLADANAHSRRDMFGEALPPGLHVLEQKAPLSTASLHAPRCSIILTLSAPGFKSQK